MIDRTELLEGIAEACRTVVGPESAGVDEQAVNPNASWAALRPLGAFTMRISPEYGGLGVDYETYVLALELIGRHCAATAVTLHMHSLMCEYVDALATDEQKKRMFAPVVDDTGLFQTMGSEPTSSPSYGLHMGTMLTPRDGGYVLNGVKHFCTMGGAATHGLAFCVLNEGSDPPNMAMDMRIAVIPTDSPGVTYFGEWNPLGMRGSVSPSVKLEDVWVERDQVIDNPIFAGVAETFGIGQVMALLGASANAFDHAVDYFQNTQLATSDKSMAHEEVIQRHMGSIAAHLAAGRSVAMDAARQFESATRPERALMAMRAKYIGTKSALHVTDALLQVVGARSIKRGSPIERAYRDVRTASLMPPNFDVMERTMGTAALGIGAQVFKTGGDDQAAAKTK